MAIKKKSSGDDEFTAADIKDEVRRELKREAQRKRKPLTIGAIVAGGVVALGAAFGVGLIAGHAGPGFPGGGDFAAGQGPQSGQGDRDGDHRGGPRDGDRDGDHGIQGGQGLQAPGSTGTTPNGSAPAPNGQQPAPAAPAPNGSAPAPGGSTTTTP